MSIENTLATVIEMANNAGPLGSTLKLNFGDSQIVIDGTGVQTPYPRKNQKLLVL